MPLLSIDIETVENEAGVLLREHLDAAVVALRAEGAVILKNIVAIEHLDQLRERMLQDVNALAAREDAPYNFNVSNIQQDPPPFPPYLFRDVMVNPLVIAVTEAILGPGVKNAAYTGNTAMPSNLRQPVHVDSGQLWANLETAPPASAIVVNVPLVKVTAENGGTEIWPGTHLDTHVSCHQDIKVPPDLLESRRALSPPYQVEMDLGSILLRDMRLWHAGMPNRTSLPRPMIAMIHYARWMETGIPMELPLETEALFAGSRLTTCAEFVEYEIDYIHGPHAYDYHPESSGPRPSGRQSQIGPDAGVK